MKFIINKIHYKLLIYRKYKLSLLYFLIAGIFILVRQYLIGGFVKVVEIYSIQISYIYFLLVSCFVADLCTRSAFAFLNKFYNKIFLTETLFFGNVQAAFGSIVSRVMDILVEYILIMIFLAFVLSTSFVRIILISPLLICVILFGLGFGMLSSVLLLYFRGKDSSVAVKITRSFAIFLAPIMFSIQMFKYYIVYEILIPSAAILEEVRKYIFLGTLNSNILVVSVIMSFVYFLLGVFIYIRALTVARKKGWVYLM